MWFKILLGSIIVISFLCIFADRERNREFIRDMFYICIASIIALSILTVFQ